MHCSFIKYSLVSSSIHQFHGLVSCAGVPDVDPEAEEEEDATLDDPEAEEEEDAALDDPEAEEEEDAALDDPEAEEEGSVEEDEDEAPLEDADRKSVV